jgi:ApaG protein
MSTQRALQTDFEVRVKVQYLEKESSPQHGHYLFAYKIQIINKGSQSAQLISRHWMITDGDGVVEEVRGAGVVGLQPRIQPGTSFEYQSACPLPTPSGSMRGFYQMISELGESFEIPIPEFYLVAPQALH